jgi:hypothetical protein
MSLRAHRDIDLECMCGCNGILNSEQYLPTGYCIKNTTVGFANHREEGGYPPDNTGCADRISFRYCANIFSCVSGQRVDNDASKAPSNCTMTATVLQIDGTSILGTNLRTVTGIPIQQNGNDFYCASFATTITGVPCDSESCYRVQATIDCDGLTNTGLFPGPANLFACQNLGFSEKVFCFQGPASTSEVAAEGVVMDAAENSQPAGDDAPPV